MRFLSSSPFPYCVSAAEKRKVEPLFRRMLRMRFVSQTSRHIDTTSTSIDRSFFSRVASMAVQYLSAPSPFRLIGGRLVTYHSRRIKIYRGSDDSGVKIHRNATTAGACIFTRVSRAANECFDVPAWVDLLDRKRKKEREREMTD